MFTARLALMSCLVAAASASAQAPATRSTLPDVSQDIAATMMGASYGVGSVAFMMIAARKCRPDKEEQWRRVIDVMDRRFWECARQEPRWLEAVSREFPEEEKRARIAGTSTGLGSLALDRLWSTATRQIEEKGVTICGLVGPFIDPASVSDKAKVDYLRADPEMTPETLEIGLQRSRSRLALAADTMWIDTPCKKFWPDAGTSN
jgi:hypothetical protein